MKKLILTVGLPRSGKSTWAKEQCLPIVNRDSIRLALHGQRYIQEMEGLVTIFEENMVKSLFLAGNDTIIIDATHMKQKYIDRWNNFCDDVELKYFFTESNECIMRAIKTGQDSLITIIERMESECDLKEFDNKWCKVFIHSISEDRINIGKLEFPPLHRAWIHKSEVKNDINTLKVGQYNDILISRYLCFQIGI